MGSLPKVFLQMWFAGAMFQCFLEYLLDLVTLDYMLLIMVYIAYHNDFDGGAVTLDCVGQLSEFFV